MARYLQNGKSHRKGISERMTRDAYGHAYQKGFELTIRFLLSRGLRRDTASEVAQAAWVRGWERHLQLRNDDFVVTWVNTIALNVYRSLLRNESLVNREVQQIPDRVVAIDLAAIDVGRMLSSCGSRDRILLEQYMDGFTMAEIARKHDSTETAIRIRLLRARRAARCRAQRRTPRPLRDFEGTSVRRRAA
jgi:DNA-directed RNA polymerase specialized sigma24 family protein